MAAANICSNLATETKCRSTLKDELTSKKLVSLFAAAKSGQAQASVCNIVSSVHPDAAGVLRQECIKLVGKCVGISDNKETQAQVRLVHKMMISCGWIDYMLEEFPKLLQKTANGCAEKCDTERTRDNMLSGKKRKVKHGVKVSVKSNRTSGKKTSFSDDYTVSVSIAWQLKDLLKHSDTCKAVMGLKSLESAVNALKVISEFNIMECMQCDYINNLHVVAYTSLSHRMSVKNHDLKNLEKTIEHVVNCIEKVYAASASRNKVTPCSIANMVKLSTSILNFIIDSSTLNRTRECEQRCLSFTRKYVGFIMLNLRQHSHGLLEFKEEDLKETFLCLKSSFTYAAKLLNLVLTSSSESSPPSHEAHNLANDLFDLIISVEEHLGSKYGSLVFSAAKLWLPDLILALRSLQIQKPLPSPSSLSSSSSAFGKTKFGFPSWLSILAKIEIFDLQESEPDDADDKLTLSSKFSTFRKIVETTVEHLRNNQSVLDAVGAFLLSGSMVGLKKKDYELLYGVLCFVCVKLMKHENAEWVDLKLMLESVRQLYPLIEAAVNEAESGDEKKLLESARSLVEPVWRCYIHEEMKGNMETDFCDC
ncbi:uncharacterized protein LOC143632166 [Bidens hawaiensis]|uniref:uncharacterized protein LOC143632166 n=1 Tax=Bidens hawaiensis TaxID=980011 RepID=UPI00404B4C98